MTQGFANVIFKSIFLNEYRIFIQISQFVPKDPIDNKSSYIHFSDGF